MADWVWYLMVYDEGNYAPVLIESPQAYIRAMAKAGHTVKPDQLLGPITPALLREALSNGKGDAE